MVKVREKNASEYQKNHACILKSITGPYTHFIPN